MTDSNHDLPQEWPEHLASQAPISAVRTVAPVGEPLLDFSSMHPTTFEQFCWWLLKKDHAVSGCKRLAGNGTAQEGIDLFAFDEQRPDRLNVFECKAWKNFGATNLTDAVNAFLDGDWVRSTGKYTIILAQRDIGGTSLARRWEKERKRLKEAGIDGDLWTAHNLTLRVQAYPDILSKFFGWAAVETYANQWMQRVAFYELVSKAFFDPRERVARWAREFVSQSSSHNDVAPSAPIAGRETGEVSALVDRIRIGAHAVDHHVRERGRLRAEVGALVAAHGRRLQRGETEHADREHEDRDQYFEERKTARSARPCAAVASNDHGHESWASVAVRPSARTVSLRTYPVSHGVVVT